MEEYNEDSRSFMISGAHAGDHRSSRCSITPESTLPPPETIPEQFPVTVENHPIPGRGHYSKLEG